jgi:hypothetical protein
MQHKVEIVDLEHCGENYYNGILEYPRVTDI